MPFGSIPRGKRTVSAAATARPPCRGTSPRSPRCSGTRAHPKPVRWYSATKHQRTKMTNGSITAGANTVRFVMNFAEAKQDSVHVRGQCQYRGGQVWALLFGNTILLGRVGITRQPLAIAAIQNLSNLLQNVDGKLILYIGTCQGQSPLNRNESAPGSNRETLAVFQCFYRTLSTEDRRWIAGLLWEKAVSEHQYVVPVLRIRIWLPQLDCLPMSTPPIVEIVNLVTPAGLPSNEYSSHCRNRGRFRQLFRPGARSVGERVYNGLLSRLCETQMEITIAVTLLPGGPRFRALSFNGIKYAVDGPEEERPSTRFHLSKACAGVD